MKKQVYNALTGVSQVVDMTEEEIADFYSGFSSLEEKQNFEKLSKIKILRLEKLMETDYMANSDIAMPDYIKTWRQTLRDLPQNNTSKSQYDALLEKNSDGTLKHSVWKKPTS
jgi:hypothetical protein